MLDVNLGLTLALYLNLNEGRLKMLYPSKYFKVCSKCWSRTKFSSISRSRSWFNIYSRCWTKIHSWIRSNCNFKTCSYSATKSGCWSRSISKFMKA